MSRPKIRVGIVDVGGVGGLGRRANSHAGGYRRCEEADLVTSTPSVCSNSARSGKLPQNTAIYLTLLETTLFQRSGNGA